MLLNLPKKVHESEQRLGASPAGNDGLNVERRSTSIEVVRWPWLILSCRPTCSNCTKSKRYCEGYHSRIVFRRAPSDSGQPSDAPLGRPSLQSIFASFEGYPLTCPPLSTGASNQALRPIAPTPLQGHPSNYFVTRDPSYIPSDSPFTATSASQSFLVDPSPIPLSADISGTFQSGSYSQPYGSTPRRDSISGPNPGYQHWAGTHTAENVQHTPFLARSSNSPSFDSIPSPSTCQDHGTGFPPGALPGHAPASHFNTTRNYESRLTSTQIAALGGQPLSPDHPFYLEMRAQINDSMMETASQGELLSLTSSRWISYSFVVFDLGQAILLTESQNMIPHGIVLRDLFSVPLSI
jgi:hypothetical protein